MAKLTGPRLWAVGTAALCAVVLVAAWMFFISPRRAQAAELRVQTTDVMASNTVLRARIAQLKEQAKNLPQQEAKLALLESQMTPVTDVAQLIRDLNGLAVDSGLDMATFSPSAPVEVPVGGAQTTAPAPAAAPSASASNGQATPAPAASSTPVAPAVTLYAMPIHITAVGDYFEASLFLKKLQTQLTRLMLIGTVGIAPTKADATASDPTHGQVTITLDTQVYVYTAPGGTKPAASAETTPAAGTQTSGTQTSGTQTSSTQTSSTHTSSTEPASTATPAPTTTSVEN